MGTTKSDKELILLQLARQVLERAKLTQLDRFMTDPDIHRELSTWTPSEISELSIILEKISQGVRAYRYYRVMEQVLNRK